MRCTPATIAFLLLTTAAAPVLAQQSPLTMVRPAVTLVRPVWQNGFSADITTPIPVHFLRGSGIDIIQQNGYDSVQADNSHPRPVHFLTAHPHTSYPMLPSLIPPHVQRIYALRAARRPHKLRH